LALTAGFCSEYGFIPESSHPQIADNG